MKTREIQEEVLRTERTVRYFVCPFCLERVPSWEKLHYAERDNVVCLGKDPVGERLTGAVAAMKHTLWQHKPFGIGKDVWLDRDGDPWTVDGGLPIPVDDKMLRRIMSNMQEEVTKYLLVVSELQADLVIIKERLE